jgi:hypothetical protein
MAIDPTDLPSRRAGDQLIIDLKTLFLSLQADMRESDSDLREEFRRGFDGIIDQLKEMNGRVRRAEQEIAVLNDRSNRAEVLARDSYQAARDTRVIADAAQLTAAKAVDGLGRAKEAGAKWGALLAGGFGAALWLLMQVAQAFGWKGGTP